MKPVTITISEKEFELYCSTKAIMDIEKRTGTSFSKISEWLGSDTEETDPDVVGILRKVSGIITDLINGGIFKHNCEIVLGLKDGDKKAFMDDGILEGILSIAELTNYRSKIYEAFNMGMDFDKPEGMPEADPDLADVESEKNVEAGV